MDIDGAKLVTPTRYTCSHCKQTNLRAAHQCSGCNQLFHKACLQKNHKYVNDIGELTECVGHEIPDDISVASSVSSVTRKKRKRYDEEVDVADIAEKVDLLLEKVEEIGINVEERKYEFRKIATEILLDIKDDLLKEVREVVKDEFKKLNLSGPRDGNSEQVMASKKKPTYAELMKGSKSETVIVEPKKKQDSSETFTEIKKNVQIGKLGVGVEKLKKTQTGKIVIGCVGKDDRVKLASELKKNMGENYTIRETDKKPPKIKVIDVDIETMEKCEENEIIDMIKKQNGVITTDKTKMIIKKKLRGKNNNGMIIIEVDPVTHKYLIEKIKIKLDWNLCRVFDCVSVLRCFKCWGLHHYAKVCKSEVKCRRCSENHMEKDCKKDIKKCVNCVKMVNDFKLEGLKTDHCANDIECEYYKRAITRAQKNINYNY